jgi:phenylacetate-CoA ligase
MREHYEASPLLLKRAVAALGRILPVSIRYGGAFAATRAVLEESGSWTAEQFGEERDRRLETLSQAAMETSYWQDVFAAHGLPSGISRAGDLTKLPLLGKDDIRDHIEDMVPPSVPQPTRKWVTTGGTTGVPLGMWLEKDASVADWAFVVDAWSRVGFRLDEKRVVLRGRRLGRGATRDLFEYEPMRRELYVSTFDLDEEHMPAIRDRIRKFGARYIHGYPSAMQALGQSYQQAGERPPALKGLLAVSEVLYPVQRHLLEQLFECRLFSFYGMTEKGAFAAECEVSTDLHVDPLYGIVELVDDSGAVIETPHTPGEVVVTGLLSHATPIIRYRTGDVGAWATGPCACGRPHRRLKAVEGRWHGTDALVGRNGARITMTALNVHSPIFDCVRRFRFVQDQPGVAELLVVPGPDFRPEHGEAMLRELSGKLSGQVTLTLRQVSDIPLSPAGKHTFVEQRIGGVER